MYSIAKTISFDQELWSKIDKLKGDIPRSRFVAKIIYEGLKVLQVDDNSSKKHPYQIK